MPEWFRPRHDRLQTALSFVAGLMLGIALLHMIPHAIHEFGSVDRVMRGVLAGFLTLFFLQRVFHYHSHETFEQPQGTCGSGQHLEASRPVSWMGTATGLGLHSLLDGLALAAAIKSGSAGGLGGFGAALAIILHKPFDSLAVITLMQGARCSRWQCWLVNLAFSLIAPLGALLFALGLNEVVEANHLILAGLLAFCGGSFLCIAASDLLPELQFHSHDRLRLSVALLAGIGVACALGIFEGEECGHAKTTQDCHQGLGDTKLGYRLNARDKILARRVFWGGGKEV